VHPISPHSTSHPCGHDRAGIIPNPLDTLEQAARWHHRDLEQGALEVRRLWAERQLIEHELARRLYCHRRPQIVYVRADGAPVSDVDWLEERARRLRAAEERQHGA
jgi:hypothetical protein